MNHGGKKEIKITLKKRPEEANFKIAYNNQIRTVSEEYAEIVFDIGHEPYHKFSLINDSGAENSSLTVLVKSVFVQ